MTELAADVDQVVAAAAMIGGISYFHEFAFDLLAENERILASTFDGGDRGAPGRAGSQRIVVLSSSMVFESTTVFPTPEGAERTSPPPISTYGFQKLASEYFARGAWEQYQLPVHDPAAVQLRGDRRAAGGPRHRRHERQREARAVARGPGPRAQGAQGPGPAAHPGRRVAGPALHVRRRPRPRDPARDGVRRRRSTTTSTSRPRRRRPCSSSRRRSGPRSTATAGRSATVSDPPFEHDVQLRVPDVRKAREVLGVRGDDLARRDARRGHPLDPRRAGGRPPVTAAAPGALDRRPRVQGGRGGRSRAPGARRGGRDAARDPRRLRLRRGPDGAGHRAAARGRCRRSAACATTSAAACSTR